MSDTRMTNLEKFSNALTRLDDAIKQPLSNELTIDGTIQRFEFCFELAWKAQKDMLFIKNGIDVPFPKPVLQEAYKAGWIENEALWLDMLKDRNNSSHTYNESLAKAIYERICQHYSTELRRLHGILTGL